MPTEEFTFTGGWQKFNVPANVKIIDVIMTGGGTTTAEAGRVVGKLRVSGDQVLWLQVGRQGWGASGLNGGDAAFGGGGPGGNGGTGGAGGSGGGGASVIRVGSKTGRIKAVAGGAGGKSGDNGSGGAGGGGTGAAGSPGTAGSGPTGVATGGTQTQVGKGGNSSLGTAYDGGNGINGKLGRGGGGGRRPTVAKTYGGGGGGGGLFPGGGGQAGLLDVAPAGGGAGGSSYTGGLYDVTSNRSGGFGHGSIKLTWETPGGSQPPTSANNITINGQAATAGMATKSTGQITLRGNPNDPNDNQDVRLLVRVSATKSFARWRTFRGTFDDQEQIDKVSITGLEQNTRYYVHVHTQDSRKQISKTFAATNFWTNRSPNPPAQILPAENQEITTLDNVTFTWQHSDPDPSDSQTAYQLRYRKAPTPIHAAGEWTTTAQVVTAVEQHVVANNVFKGNTHYEWQVRTRDEQNKWGAWALGKSFFVRADATPPILLEPVNHEAIVAAEENLFRWKFLGPQDDVAQARVDIRYRVVGTEPWTTIFGDVEPGIPGPDQEWLLAADTFVAGEHYEYQIKSYSSEGFDSDWSEPDFFWTVEAPGSGAGIELLDSGRPQDPLGEGHNRAFIYDRGGLVYRGEITPLAEITWGRKRDDISKVSLKITEWDERSRPFLRDLRTWYHEIVVFREVNGVQTRVWEGPITRISGNRHGLEVEAWDCWAYVYRRILRQGYNDSYRKVNGVQLGLKTVVHRAQHIVMNALAYDDPNVLAYLTPIHNPGDAENSRIRPDYSRTAWEEVDDLAALAGLDYTASGRRLLLWDTHRPIGRLPEMKDHDFSADPIITEYGMSAANYFAVTTGNGVWGAADRFTGGVPGPEGFLEQLASAYGESEGGATQQTLSREALSRLRAKLAEQADRNISGRWPPPVVVRVPDNSTLSVDLNLGINQLIPGVWVPLRSTGGVRELAQWQKLDSMTVTEKPGDGEKIAVVFSPAPNEGQDPDADTAVEEE